MNVFRRVAATLPTEICRQVNGSHSNHLISKQLHRNMRRAMYKSRPLLRIRKTLLYYLAEIYRQLKMSFLRPHSDFSLITSVAFVVILLHSLQYYGLRCIYILA